MSHNDQNSRAIAAAIGRLIALVSIERIRDAESAVDRIRILREAILDATRDPAAREETVSAFALLFGFQLVHRELERNT